MQTNRQKVVKHSSAGFRFAVRKQTTASRDSWKASQVREAKVTRVRRDPLSSSRHDRTHPERDGNAHFAFFRMLGRHGYAPIAKFHEVFSAEGQNIKLGSLHYCDKNFLVGLLPWDGEIDTFFSAETVSYTDDARCRVTNI